MEVNVAKKLRQLENEIEKLLKDEDDAGKTLNQTQLQVLNYLMSHENVIQKDLENETQLKKSSITGCIDSMVEKGIVKRIKADDDKRKNIVVLTKKAIEGRKMLEDKIIKLNDQIVGKIDRKDLETFSNVLDQMIENLKGVD